MATAFAGHSLSTLTNSCVKLPINPKSKLAATFTERGGIFKPNDVNLLKDRRAESEKSATKNGASKTFNSENQNGLGFAGSGRPNDSQDNDDRGETGHSLKPDELFERLRDNIDLYTDEEFYTKLLEMKNEHRKTLHRLEVLYDQKLSLKDHDDMEKSTTHSYFEREDPPFTKSGPVYMGDHKLHHIDDEIEQFTKSQDWSAKKDNVRDMSAKPPIGRPKTAWAGKTRRSLHRSASSERWHDITWTSDTSGQDTSGSGSELDDSGTHHRRRSNLSSLSSSYSTSRHLVDRMWDDFSVDEYAPRSRSNSRASSVRSTSSKKAKEWSPKITIPKPFQMTQREAAKEKTKSKACLELEHELAEKEKAEEAECQKKFKATPAPAHTYLPLYDELKEKEIENSRKNRENGKARLMSQQKPFSFMKREEEKKKHRRTQSLPLTAAKRKNTKQFEAREIPKSVFDPTVSDRILEEEEYRKIRIKMRAEEMLRQSSLPSNMQQRGREYTDGRMRQKLFKSREKKAFLTTEHKFRPNVNGEVPDYDELYRQFQKEVQRKKKEKEPTVVQPFNLRTSRIPSRTDKILDELKQEEELRKEKLRGSTSKSLSLRSSLNISEDAVPTKTTTASKLRQSLMEKTLKEEAANERKRVEMERQKRLKEKKLKQFITRKALANDRSESLSNSSKTKLQNYIQAGKSRQAEYERELKEMMARVESRPLLFERQSQVNAKKAAERKYQQALKEAGLDADFLETKGHLAGSRASTQSYNYSDESDDEDDLNFGVRDEGHRDVSIGSRDRFVSESETRPSYDDQDFDDDNDSDENRSISSIHSEEA